MKEKERELFRPKEFYRKKIIKEVENIESEWILGQIYQFIQNMTKEGN